MEPKKPQNRPSRPQNQRGQNRQNGNNNHSAGSSRPKNSRPAQNGNRPPQNGGRSQQRSQGIAPAANRTTSRGAAIRAHKRTQEDAQKALSQYGQTIMGDKPRVSLLEDDTNKLKISFLGGQHAIGEKNMQIIEWQNDAIIIDCGNHLGVDLPGVNYTIADTTYLETIKHKIRGYIISHGHLDHLGGLKHIVPKFPAPIHGSRFTIGVVEKTFEDLGAETGVIFTPKTIIMNMDGHERLKLGVFMIELIRITHSVPESSAICIDTPVGRVINTGDWRLDPEPLDEKPTDVERLKQLGDEGVLLMMSDSTNTTKPGRTPTEHTLQQSFHDIIGRAEGRVFCAIFSSNMNRVQMIVNAAVESGRRVALDGRSMMSYAEIAVRQGILKIPKGTVLAMREMPNIPENQVLVICTGGQGEPNAALQRMAEGTHKHIKLQPKDTVIISSTPIPGNEVRYQEIGDELSEFGVHLYRHPTYEIDNIGPLHVSGHAARDEYREILHIVRPKFFLPVYAGYLNRRYYQEMAIEEGWSRDRIIMANNGDSILFTADKYQEGNKIPHGTLLVDQTGTVVSNVVIKDRMMLAEEGLVAVILTIDKKSGQLLTSPDIISRGFIYMKDNEELMNAFRAELRRAVTQRFKRVDLDRFKAELKDYVTHFLYDQTQRSPIVIPVVNIIGGRGEKSPQNSFAENSEAMDQPKSAEQVASEQQQRFAKLRQQLLHQDQK